MTFISQNMHVISAQRVYNKSIRPPSFSAQSALFFHSAHMF